MRARSLYISILFALLFQTAFGQQSHEIELRLAPSSLSKFSDSETDPLSGDSTSQVDSRGLLEFDVCYSIVRDTGRFLRARAGHLIANRGGHSIQTNSEVDFEENRNKAFVSFGIGRNFSLKNFSIRMGVEYILAWQYWNSMKAVGSYLNSQGNPEKMITTTDYPNEITSSLQLFLNLRLRLSNRISTGIEFRQPLNLVFIHGKKEMVQTIFDGDNNLLSTETATETRKDLRLETNFVFSPLIGISIKL